MSPDDPLRQALDHQRAGRLAQAETIYRALLQQQPNHPDALHLLGMLYHQGGQPQNAKPFLDRALELLPDAAVFHNNLGEIHRTLKEFDLAAACYERALALQPSYTNALNNLGIVYSDCGRLDEAQSCFERALAITRDLPETLLNFGLLWRKRKDADRARACFEEAVRCHPRYAKAHYQLGVLHLEARERPQSQACFEKALELQPNLAEVHNNLGILALDRGEADRAKACFDRAIALQPKRAEFLANLGNAFRRLDAPDRALDLYEKALAIDPESAEVLFALGSLALSKRQPERALALFEKAAAISDAVPGLLENRGVSLNDLGRSEEALVFLHAALLQRPDSAEVWNNLGIAHQNLGDLAEAVRSFRKALECDPDYAVGHWNLGLLLLTQGQFREGWPQCEWRWQVKEYSRYRSKLTAPTWRGEELAGKTLFVHSEQGIGDAIQFIRFLKCLPVRGPAVQFWCPVHLQPLLRTLDADVAWLSHDAQMPPHQFATPLASLPLALGIELHNLPNETPYLHADPVRVEKWRRVLDATPGRKIGIAWQGNPEFLYDRFRSIPLREFAPLARLPNIRLVPLQKGFGREQVDEFRERWPLLDLGPDLDSEAAFVDTAAILKGLDLLVTSDSAIAHLAGALGVKVWMALPFAADWRWMHGRDDSPWYPTMRLFRQRTRGDWSEVFDRIADAVATEGDFKEPRPT